MPERPADATGGVEVADEVELARSGSAECGASLAGKQLGREFPGEFMVAGRCVVRYDITKRESRRGRSGPFSY